MEVNVTSKDLMRMLHKIVESVDVKVDDLKTKKFKHQENILDSESEDDDELVGTQTDV